MTVNFCGLGFASVYRYRRNILGANETFPSTPLMLASAPFTASNCLTNPGPEYGEGESRKEGRKQ